MTPLFMYREATTLMENSYIKMEYVQPFAEADGFYTACFVERCGRKPQVFFRSIGCDRGVDAVHELMVAVIAYYDAMKYEADLSRESLKRRYPLRGLALCRT